MYYRQHQDKNSKAEAIRRRRDLVMRDDEEKAEMSAQKKNVQPKLEINQPGDVHEQQADAVAQKVSDGKDASGVLRQQLSSTPSTQMKSEGVPQVPQNFQTQLDSSKGNGQSLSENVQKDIGGKMGADLSDVKIHTGSNAHEMSEGINAKAFTHGQDIYFKNGNYNPESKDGKELLAHELTHTVQQGGDKVQPMIQRFESNEHKKMGDVATGSKEVVLSPYFKCSFGDMTALSGDFFESLDQMKKLAAVDGTEVGTVAELKYALEVGVHKKATSSNYSKAVIKEVDTRANSLVLTNYGHFTNPEEKDRTKTAQEKRLYGALVIPQSSPEGYRIEHENAVRIAYYAGAYQGQPLNSDCDLNAAILHESFASHYLSDAFASGHTRVPRESINDYWNKKIPLFGTNLYGWMAEIIAGNMTMSSLTGASFLASTVFPTIRAKYNYVLGIMPSMVPQSEMGDIISGALHDYENKKGLKVKTGDETTILKGDSEVVDEKGNVKDQNTFTRVIKAINLSLTEIYTAFNDGKTLSKVDQSKWESWNKYADRKLKKKGLYPVEKLWPEAAPDADTEPKWKVDTFDQLFDDPKMATALNLLAIKNAKRVLEKIDGLDKDAKSNNVAGGMLVIAGKLTGDAQKVKKTFNEVINWTPGTMSDTSGVVGQTTDDDAYDYYLKAKENYIDGTFTIKQKQQLINAATPTPMMGTDEDMIIDILGKTKTSDLSEVFKGISYESIYKGMNGDNKTTFKTKYEKYSTVKKKSLEINSPQDASEKEADEVARKVADGHTAEVKNTSETISRKDEGSSEVPGGFQTQLSSSKGNGQSLSENVQKDIGGKMGADLSDVKIHTGSNAHEMSEGINAKAFTHGQDIYFKNGNYNPESKDGKELLAHELTHTVQQKDGLSRKKIQRWTYDNVAPKIISDAVTFNKAHITYSVPIVKDLYHLSGDYELYNVVLKTAKIDKEFIWLIMGAQEYLKNSVTKVDGQYSEETKNAIAKWTTKTATANFKAVSTVQFPEIVKTLKGICGNIFVSSIVPNSSSKEFSFLILSAQRSLFPGQKEKFTGIYDKTISDKVNELIEERKAQQKQQVTKGFVGDFSVSADKTATAIRPQLLQENKFKKVDVVWAGDPFYVEMSIGAKVSNSSDMGNFGSFVDKKKFMNDVLTVTITYTGDKYTDRQVIQPVDLNIPTGKNNYSFFIKPFTDTSNSEEVANYLFIDLFGDGKQVCLLTDKMRLNKSWTPPWQTHEMYASWLGTKAYGLREVNVKPLNAKPTKNSGEYSIPKTSAISDKTTLTAYQALLAAQSELHNIIDNEGLYGISKSNYNWFKLENNLNNEIGKTYYNKSEDPLMAARAAGLKSTINYAKPLLTSIAQIQHPEMHPEKIAAQAVKLVTPIRKLLDEAVLLSFTDLKNSKALFQKAGTLLEVLPYQLTNLYLQDTKGLAEQFSQMDEISSRIHEFRDSAGLQPKYPNIEKKFGIVSSYAEDAVSTNMASDLKNESRGLSNKSAEGSRGVYESVMSLSSTAKHASSLLSMVSMYELLRKYESQFGVFATTVDILLPSNAKDITVTYLAALDGLMAKLDKQYASDKTTGFRNAAFQLSNTEVEVMSQYFRIVSTDKFKKDLDFIVGRLQKVESIRNTVKKLAIIAMAAVMATYAAPLGGMMMTSLGVSSASAVALGSFATEVLVFTIMDRMGSELAFGKNESSFLEDLTSNAIMFGMLKGVGEIHSGIFKKFASPADFPGIYKVTGYSASLISLHAIATAQYRIAKGHGMSAGEHLETLIENVVLMKFIKIGNSIAEPMVKRLDARVYKMLNENNFKDQLKSIEESRLQLKAKNKALKDAIDAKKEVSPEDQQQLILDYQDQHNKDVKLLEDAKAKLEADSKKQGAKKGIDPKLIDAEISKYRQKIVGLELEMAQMGFDVQTGPTSNFRVIEKGVIAYDQKNSAQLLGDMKANFESKGGTFEEKGKGIYVGTLKGQKTTYVPEGSTTDANLPAVVVDRILGAGGWKKAFDAFWNNPAMKEYLSMKGNAKTNELIKRMVEKEEWKPEEPVKDKYKEEMKKYLEEAKLVSIARSRLENIFGKDFVVQLSDTEAISLSNLEDLALQKLAGQDVAEIKKVAAKVLEIQKNVGRPELLQMFNDRLKSEPYKGTKELFDSYEKDAKKATALNRAIFDAIVNGEQFPDWVLTDTPMEFDLNGNPTKIITEITYTNPKNPKDVRKGFMIRYVETAQDGSKTLVMDYAFFYDLPKWIENKVPLTTKGTPLILYLNLRQMKLLGLGFGEIKAVKMSNIQNVESIVKLHYMQENGMGNNFNELIKFTQSFDYANNAIIQSGGKIESVAVKGGINEPISEIMRRQENGAFDNAIEEGKTNTEAIEIKKDAVEKNQKLLDRYGYKRNTMMKTSFDVDIKLKK